MPTFDVDREPITVFEIDEQYLFTHYTISSVKTVFTALNEYYNGEQYRFEVPVDEFETVRETLREHFYEPVVETGSLEPYCVVKEQYTALADMLRNSVVHWSHEGHNFFILKDEQSVREAVEQGATPIAQTEFVISL